MIVTTTNNQRHINMRRIFTLIPIVLLFIVSSINAQVTSAKFVLQYNCESNLYDVKLKIVEGSATSIGHRAQFNSQISIAVPTGSILEISERFLPLENNQNYSSTKPNDWALTSPVYAPMGLANYDFYSASPKLSPASFYNDLEEGDEVTLFNFSLSGNTEYDESVRLFNNVTDTNMGSFDGADLRNGFTLGGSSNIYSGNIHRSCTTTTKNIKEDDFLVYPNPVTENLFVEVPTNTKSIKLLNVYGRKMQEIKNPPKGTNSINVGQLDTGIYYILLDLGEHHLTKSISVQ